MLVVLVVSVEPPASEEPPVVEVFVDAEFDVPAPVAPVLLEVVFELELELEDDELKFVALEVEFDVVDVWEPPVVVVCVEGLAALVVGTVRSGAPVVSLLPEPLPPHAASAIAISKAAPTPNRRR